MLFGDARWTLLILCLCFSALLEQTQATLAPYSVQVGQSQELGIRFSDDFYKFQNTCYEEEDALEIGVSDTVDETSCLAACTNTAYCEAVVIPVGADVGNPCLFVSRAQVSALKDCTQTPSNVELFLKPQAPQPCQYVPQDAQTCLESSQRQLLGTFTKVTSPGEVLDRDRCRVNNDDNNDGDFTGFPDTNEADCRTLCEDTLACVAYEYLAPNNDGQGELCEIHSTPVTNAIAADPNNPRQVCFTYARAAPEAQPDLCQVMARANPNCGPTVQFELAQGESAALCNCSPPGSNACTVQDAPGATLYNNTCLRISVETLPPTILETPAPGSPTASPTALLTNAVGEESETLTLIGVSSGVVVAATLFTVAMYLRSKPNYKTVQNSGPTFPSLTDTQDGKTRKISSVSSQMLKYTTTASTTGSFSIAGPPPSEVIKAEKKRRRQKRKENNARKNTTSSAMYYPNFVITQIKSQIPSLRSSQGGTLRESEIVSVQSPSFRFTNFFSKKPKKNPPSLPPRIKTPADSHAKIDMKSAVSQSKSNVSREHQTNEPRRKHKRDKNPRKKVTQSEKLFTMV